MGASEMFCILGWLAIAFSKSERKGKKIRLLQWSETELEERKANFLSWLRVLRWHSVDTFRDYKYLGTRIRVDGIVKEYKWMTHGEAGTAQSAIGSSLIYHGISKGSCIGLYFISKPEWLIVEHTCSAYLYISVPLYDTLGPDAVKYIVNHATVQVIFHVSASFIRTVLSWDL